MGVMCWRWVNAGQSGMQSRSKPRIWLSFAQAGLVLAIAMLGSVLPARALCDANTAGVSVCSGTDLAVTKTATGNLDVQFNNETVTTGGVTISGGVGGFNVDLNVTSASVPSPIANTGGGNAIDISSTSGNVAVTTIAGATVTSVGTNGILASTGSGGITINTAAVTTNSTGFGINAAVTGGGTDGIAITTNGTITSTGGTAINSSVTGGSGNTAITFNADVLFGAALGPAGIQAVSSSTGSMIVTGSGNVSGAGSGGAINVSNTAAVTSGDLTVNTSGNFNNFISATITQAANNANISVAHAGTLSSSLLDAITATTAGGGNVSVTTSKLVQTSGAVESILARTASGGITINTAAVTTNSTGFGINAAVTGGGTDGIAITTNGTITSTGGTAINSSVTGGSGNTAITFNADVLFGAAAGPAGIQAVSSSTGSMLVTGSGNVSGAGSGGAINVSNTAAATSGDLTVNTSGNFNNFISATITQAANNANISVAHAGTLSSSLIDAITATTAGGGNVSVTTSKLVQTSGAVESILARTASGGITINTAAVTTNSTGFGINAAVTGGGTDGIAITTNGTITSTGGTAINSSVTGGSGNTAITFNADVLFGAAAGPAGIQAVSSSTGSMLVTGSGNVSGAGSGGAINVSNTAAATSGDLTVNTSGNFNNFISATITQAANNANISVAHAGTLSSSLIDAITATTAGGGNVSVTTSKLVQTSGASESILASTAGGGITINTAAVTTNSTGFGINAAVTGGGTDGIAITTNGTITSTGGTAINSSVTGGSGGILINSNGAIDAPLANGIVAKIAGAGTGNVTVNINAAVTANAAGIGLDLAGGTTTTVTNNSTISAGTGIRADHVALNNTATGVISGSVGVQTLAGPSSIFNAGTINGTGGTAIQFAGSGNTLTIAPTSLITGNAIATGADSFQLGGSGIGSFNASLIGPAAQYRGFASYNKVDASIWTLTGTNALVLPWTVQKGTLNVTGTLVNSPFTVNGGILEGNGSIGTTQINTGGTFAPGSPGTPGTSIVIAGNLAFQSGALYLVQVNPSTASLANVTGTATLSGNVLAVFTPGNYVRKQYDILHAGGGRSGTFAAVSSNLPPGFVTSLSYTNTDVFLNLNAGLGAGGGLNVNQQNVANAINNFFNNGGSLPPSFATVFGLGGGNLANALTQLSGETATGSQQVTFNAMGLFLGLMTDPFIVGRGNIPATGSPARPFAEEDDYGASAYASNGARRTSSERDAYGMITKAPPRSVNFDQRWSVWAAGFGGSQTTDGNTAVGSNNTTSSIAGTAVGVDYLFSPNTIAGFALAGGGTNFSVANNLGSGRSDLFQAGAYLRHTNGPAYVSAALAYGWQDITTNRTVTVSGIDQLRAEFNANAFSGRLEGGYRFVSPWMGGIGITPYAAGQFTTFDLPAYAEQAVVGSNTFALAYGAKSVTDTRSELGLRTDKSYAQADGILTLRGRVAWAHDFNPDRNIGATFQTLPGASFVVNGAAQAPNSAVVTASAEKKWLNGWSAAVTFEGEFSSVTESYAGKGVVRYSW